jgi:cell division protein FtsB
MGRDRIATASRLGRAEPGRVDMSAAGSYDSRHMNKRPSASLPPDRHRGGPTRDAHDEPDAAEDERASLDPATTVDGIDLSSLSIAGITRRRVGWLTAALVSAWIVIVFARQAGDAATAASRVDQMTDDNRNLAAEVASLEQELQTIEKPTYIAQQARSYRLGTDREVPFTLDSSVPAPGADAPGSAALRLGARDKTMTPLESWLSLLFGPSS